MAVWQGNSVWASGGKPQWVNIKEQGEEHISLKTESWEAAVLTVEEARSLGAHLMNLATRVEKRNGR